MTTTGPETAPFTAETFQNEYLATGVDTVDAVVTVAAAGEAAEAGATPSTDRAEVVIFDTSGSMGTGRKMAAAKEAAAAAVDSLDDGVSFAVIAGDHEAKLLWPQDGRSFAVADADDRAGAKAAIARAEPAGGTAIGTWLDLARQLFGTTTAPARHAILLTDGRNEHQQPYELQAAIAACRGLFQCDCRGVGVDWEVEEMRGIATALLGTVDIVADPADLAADFQAMISSSQARGLPDVKLRLWAPQGAVIDSVRQVAPEVLDLTAAGEASGPLARDYLLGGWAPGESRDYHLRITVTPGGVGEEMLAGRVSLVLTDGTVATQALIRAVWTDDTVKSTRIDRHVAHYTGQVELADAIQEGLHAAKAGDEATATVKLGRAVQLAQASGHEDTMRLLREVVDVDDPERGTVRLRKGTEKAAEMTLDTRSTRTVRLGKGDPDGGGAS
ncbi:MAG TPA: VWA domain-containing protein [Acidimicrobiales bacterium]|nr:VWA domain-containing protein [Acidimicrobiales bacterium]